jgi:glycosyltransferase involved in cell wall biosynthesis
MADGPLRGVRVVALVPRLWPTTGTGHQRTTSMVTGFVEAGAHVTAYVPEPAHAIPPRPPALDPVDVRIRSDRLSKVNDYIAYPPTLLGMSDRFVLFSRKVLAEARRSTRPDIVFVSASPFSAFVSAAALAKHFGVPLVGDLRDEWARSPFAGKLGPVHQRLEERREVKAMASTTALSAPIPEIFDALVEPFAGPTRVIEHGCDVAAVRAGVGPPPPLGPDEPLLVVYAGMRYGDITEEGFVRTFARLSSAQPVTLRLVGCARPAVEAPPGLTIEVLDQVPHRELLRHYGEAHALLNFLPAHGLMPVRSKFEEYKATGRPVLAMAAAGSRLNAMTSAHAGGWAVSEGDADGLGQALMAIRRSAEARIDHAADRQVRSFADVGREASELLLTALEAAAAPSRP